MKSWKWTASSVGLLSVGLVLFLALVISGCAMSDETRYRIADRRAQAADFAIACKRAGGVLYPRGIDGRAARPQCYDQ